MSESAEYRSWRHAIQRCHNPNDTEYHNYGARGIAVCAEWRGRGGFDRFLAHIGSKPSPRHSIDRIDNERGYEPGNVRWATPKEQAANRRRHAPSVLLDGERVTQSEIARRVGVSRERVRQLLARGDSVETILAGSYHRDHQRKAVAA